MTRSAERCHTRDPGTRRSSCGSAAPSAAGTSLVGKRQGALGGGLALHSCEGGMSPGGQGGFVLPLTGTLKSSSILYKCYI